MGEWHAEVLVGLAVLAALYLGLARVQRRRLPPGRLLSMTAALAVLAGTLNGPLHDLSDRYLFSAHMVQHLLLTLVVPPLLLAGIPHGLLSPLLAAPRMARLLAWLTRLPIAFVLYNAVLVFWHLPGPYDAALEHHPLHIVQHLTFIGTAVLAWWPIISPEPRLPAAPYGAQMLYLFLLGVPMTAIAAFVTLAPDPLYRFYATAPRVWDLSPLEDQRLGGVIMWVPAAIAPLAAFTGVFFRWAAAESD
jgi:putative membrane protein